MLGHPTFAGVLNSLAWGATIAFGATVLVARFRHAPSRTLGLQVFGLGVLGILINLMDIEQDPGMDRLYLRAAMVLAIVEPFALLAFLMSWPWPRLRGGAALWSWGPLAPALGLVAAFVADPDPWIPAFAFVVFTTWLLAGVTAFVIFLQAFSLQPGPARESAFVVGVAVASAVIVDTVFWTLARWAPPTRLIDFLAWALSLLGLYLSVLVVLLYMIRRRSLGEERLRVRDRMVLVLPVGALAGSLASVAAHYVVSPALGYQVWEIAGALQCAGAIVVLVNAAAKHQMLGLEFGIKWTLRRGTVAAAFVGAYFLASEGAQLVLAERFGPLIGLGGAALLLTSA